MNQKTKGAGVYGVVVVGLVVVSLLMGRGETDLGESDRLLAQVHDDSHAIHPIPEAEQESRQNERARNEKYKVHADRFIQSVAQLETAAHWQTPPATAARRGDPPVLVPRPGSENPVETNQNVWLDLIGVSPEKLAGTKLLHYPRNDVFVMDGQSWGGKPFVLFSAQKNGGYLLAVITEGEEGIEVGEYEVSVGGQPNPPEPLPPNPPSPPTPVPPDPSPDPSPDPLDGLALRVRNWGITEVSPGARNLAGALSDSFLAVASRIAAGTFRDPQAIIDATHDSNRLAIGMDGREKWLDFYDALRIYLNLESDEKRLVTVQQYEKVWREIAEGLTAVEGYE